MYSWPHVLLLNLILYRVLYSYSVPLLGIELLTLWLVVQGLITQPHSLKNHATLIDTF